MRRSGKRYRALHVTPYGPEAWAYGGIPRVVESLTGGLASRGHEVTVAATDARDRLGRLTSHRRMGLLMSHPPRLCENLVELRVFPNLSNRLAYHQQLFLPLGLRRYLRRHVGEFHLVHIHGYHHLPGALAGRACGRHGVPYVLTPNGTAPRLEGRRLAKWVFDSTAGRRVLPDAARVLAVSEFERRQLRALGIADERIRIVPNPVPEVDFQGGAEPGEFRQRWKLSTAPVILFLGQIIPRKRLDVVVEAFSRLPDKDSRLVVVGTDRGALPRLERDIGRLGVAERTVFTGLLKGADRYRALADADVVVYPSQHEVFGLVALEAILCGTPVVVAEQGGCGEMVTQVGGGRTVPVGDAEALAVAIVDLLRDQETVRREAEAAQSEVRRLYSMDGVAQRLEAVYEEVLGSREDGSISG